MLRVLRPPTCRPLRLMPGVPRRASSRLVAPRALICSAVMTVIAAGASARDCELRVAVTTIGLSSVVPAASAAGEAMMHAIASACLRMFTPRKE